MSRYEEMLSVLLSSIQVCWKLKPMMAQGVRERFAVWKEREPALALALDASSFLDQVPAKQDVWRVDEGHFLYRDRYLRIAPTFEGYLVGYFRTSAEYASIQGAVDDNWFRYGLLAPTRENLVVRLRQPATVLAAFTMHMNHLLRIYTGEPDDGTPLFSASKRLYTLTAPFFGQGFRPLMEALKLHLSGERERVLHPFATENGGCLIVASLVDRLVTEHLGLMRFSCRSGKRAVGQDEHYDARLEAYSGVERDRVASSLAAQCRPSRAMEVRLLLCELALRKVIPSAVYVVQAE